MSKNIKFSPEYGRNCAKSIGASKGAIESEVKKLENLIVRNLCQTWEGQASDKYRTEFTALKGQVMDKFVVMLGELQTQLNEISRAIEDADNQIAGKIKMR